MGLGFIKLYPNQRYRMTTNDDGYAGGGGRQRQLLYTRFRTRLLLDTGKVGTLTEIDIVRIEYTLTGGGSFFYKFLEPVYGFAEKLWMSSESNSVVPKVSESGEAALETALEFFFSLLVVALLCVVFWFFFFRSNKKEKEER
jgi:hypothetical protein